MSKVNASDANASERYACAFALAFRAANGKGTKILARLLNTEGELLAAVLDALHHKHVSIPPARLLPLYGRSPQAVAAAVSESAQPNDAVRLRRFLKGRDLRPEIRDVVIGLLKVGEARDVRLVLEAIAASGYKVTFWNVPVVTSAMASRADNSLKPWLIQLTKSPEFWDYLRERPENPLPVAIQENLYLFKRISGVVLAAVCDRSDWQLLNRLVFHSYWSIQVAAAEKIAEFVTSLELDQLLNEARNKATDSPDEGVIYALNFLDQKLYSRPNALAAAGSAV